LRVSANISLKSARDLLKLATEELHVLLAARPATETTAVHILLLTAARKNELPAARLIWPQW
jgi:hypothetical protein